MSHTASFPAADPVALRRIVKLGLTPRQADVFLVIFTALQTSGVQPSLRELVDHYGFSGPASFVSHLKGLASKGWIEPTTNQSRAIRFLKTPTGATFRGFTLPGPKDEP